MSILCVSQLGNHSHAACWKSLCWPKFQNLEPDFGFFPILWRAAHRMDSLEGEGLVVQRKVLVRNSGERNNTVEGNLA